MKTNNRSTKRQGGAVAVEFALVLVLMVMLVAGMVEFGRAFWYLDTLTKATRDGARYLSNVTLNNTNIATAGQKVVSAVNDAGIAETVTVSVSCLDATFAVMSSCTGSTNPEYIKVSITGFTAVIGSWFPILQPSGGVMSFSIFLPQTTMRYMKG
jgi:Flp pilus assembly protein TadG